MNMEASEFYIDEKKNLVFLYKTIMKQRVSLQEFEWKLIGKGWAKWDLESCSFANFWNYKYKRLLTLDDICIPYLSAQCINIFGIALFLDWLASTISDTGIY